MNPAVSGGSQQPRLFDASVETTQPSLFDPGDRPGPSRPVSTNNLAGERLRPTDTGQGQIPGHGKRMDPARIGGGATPVSPSAVRTVGRSSGATQLEIPGMMAQQVASRNAPQTIRTAKGSGRFSRAAEVARGRMGRFGSSKMLRRGGLIAGGIAAGAALNSSRAPQAPRRDLYS